MKSKAVLTILAVAMCFLLFACAQSGGNESDIAAFQDRVSNDTSKSNNIESSNSELSNIESSNSELSNIESESNITCIHDYEELSCTAATCTTDGSRLLQCKKCGYETTISVPALNHDWQDATCTTPKTCKRCGKTSGQIEHKYKLASSTNATCTKDGINTYRCEVCGNTYSEVMEKAKGHKWLSATCEEPKKCSVCGITEGNARGHEGSVVCTICGKRLVSVGMQNAYRQLKSLDEYMYLSRNGYREMLLILDYTEEEANFAINNVTINYKKNAVEQANTYLEYTSTSRDMMIYVLEEIYYFTNEEAIYGVSNCGADWFEHAVKCAENYLEFMPMSRTQLYNQLEYEKFTVEQIEHALKTVGY